MTGDPEETVRCTIMQDDPTHGKDFDYGVKNGPHRRDCGSEVSDADE
jgi:hypothetical protein